MGLADTDIMTAQICAELGSQLGAMFHCSSAGAQVQIRTPFVFPDGDLIDVYWRDTDCGPVVSDLGDTWGWLFINGGNESLTDKQNRAYAAACKTYGVERRGGVLLARVSNGNVADVVVRLAQAITAVSQVLDLKPAQETVKTSARQITVKRITTTLQKYRGHGWRYQENCQMAGQSNRDWKLNFMVRTPEQDAALFALHGRKHTGWQWRAIEHAFTAFSDLVPTLNEMNKPTRAVSVIDDIDVPWDDEPIELLNSVSAVVRLSDPESLPQAIAERW